jgi:hypothetical protein
MFRWALRAIRGYGGMGISTPQMKPVVSWRAPDFTRDRPRVAWSDILRRGIVTEVGFMEGERVHLDYVIAGGRGRGPDRGRVVGGDVKIIDLQLENLQFARDEISLH